MTAAALEARLRKAGHAVSANGLVRPEIAAAVCEASPGTLRNWRCAQTGPRWHKLPAGIFYAVADLAEWLSARRSE